MKYLNLKFIYIWSKYFFSKYSRYRHIYNEIIKCKPKNILEVGVYKGKRAHEMIFLASSFNRVIQYYGFDLFEKMKKSKIATELSKEPESKLNIKKKLSTDFKNAKIKLIQGDTKNTLKKFSKLKKKIDFVFIDGGHSLSTIQSDWKYIKKILNKKSIVIFDDYYGDHEIIKKFGCNKVIQKLGNKFKYEVLQSNDYIKKNKKNIKNSLVKVTFNHS